MADRQQVYEAIRRADQAGDRASVERLGRYLKEMDQAKPQPKTFWGQLKDATGNVVAGGIEGAAAIPDAVIEALAGGMRTVANPVARASSAFYRGIGQPELANRVEGNRRMVDQALSRPATVARGVQRVAPVPKDTAGQIARFGAQFVGGAGVPMGPKVTPPARIPTRVAPKGLNTDVVRAGQRQNVPIRRPDAMPELRGDMAAAEASQYGGPVIARARAGDEQVIQDRIAKIAGGGRVQTEDYNLGQQIQGVGKKYIEQTGKAASQMYRQADELSGNTRISPQNAIAEIDNNIAELSQQGAFTNATTIDYLRGLRSDLAKNEGFSVTDFQGLRSAARKKIKGDQALTSSDAERRLGNVTRAFSQDARDQLPKQAADVLDEADRFYADRMDFIGNVLQRNVLGRRNNPLSPEKTAKNLQAMAKNRADYDTFSRFWGVADPETQSDFAATFANNLGTGRNGDFGIGRLASDIEAVPQNIRQTMYGNEGAQSLDDIRTIALAKSGTTQGLNNSRTAPALMRGTANTFKRAAPAAVAGYVAGGPMGAMLAPALTEGLTAASQYRTAQSLLNPDFARALAPAMPSLIDTAAPFAARAPIAGAANLADELGGLFGQRFVPSLAADERERKKKKK